MIPEQEIERLTAELEACNKVAEGYEEENERLQGIVADLKSSLAQAEAKVASARELFERWRPMLPDWGQVETALGYGGGTALLEELDELRQFLKECIEAFYLHTSVEQLNTLRRAFEKVNHMTPPEALRTFKEKHDDDYRPESSEDLGQH